MKRLAAAFACLLVPAAAFADATGTYNVVGINPNDGSQYRGTVEVKRVQATYEVIWTIGSSQVAGRGIGAHAEGGRLVAGPAGSNDTALSVGYASGNAYGVANYYLQPDGSWQGVWTYAGSGKVASETWLPK